MISSVFMVLFFLNKLLGIFLHQNPVDFRLHQKIYALQMYQVIKTHILS